MLRLTIDLGQIAKRASGTHEVFTRRQSLHVRLCQAASDETSQASKLLGAGRVRLEEFLTQSQRTEWEADAFGHAAARESRDLHAAAADIEEQSVRHRQSSYGSDESVS